MNYRDHIMVHLDYKMIDEPVSMFSCAKCHRVIGIPKHFTEEELKNYNETNISTCPEDYMDNFLKGMKEEYGV